MSNQIYTDSPAGKTLPPLLSRQSALIFGLFLLTSFILRFFTLFPSVINHDESTYILIANTLLNGDIYWVDAIDTKPIGIFLLFALFQSLFGYNILSIRLMSILWVALTSLFLYRAHRKIGGDHIAGLTTGFMFILITSMFVFFGLSPNTELFFILFTIVALNIILDRPSPVMSALAGLLLGFGYIIKPVVFFDFIAFSMLFFILYRKDIRSLFLRLIPFTSAFAIPFLLVGLYYWSKGLVDVFLFYTFDVSVGYLRNSEVSAHLKFIFDFFGRFFFITIPFIYCLISPYILSKQTKVFVGIWSLLIWAVLLLPGKFFYHYTIQFMLPFTLLAGSILDKRREHGRFTSMLFNRKIGIPILLILISGLLYAQKEEMLDKPDISRKVAEYLNDHLGEDDRIYTGDTHQIIYLLTGKESPIPYVHRTLLQKKDFTQLLNIDAKAILDSIQNDPDISFFLNEKEPAFIPADSIFVRDTVVGNVTIYRRHAE